MRGVNKYGLAKDIPSKVKRLVRQNSGFGCVICGLSLYHYDHVDPPWAEAREHRPDAICLLCPDHHERKKKGFLTIEEIKAAYHQPHALRVGYSHDREFRTCRRPLKIRLGNFVFNDPHEVLRVAGERLLAVEDLEDGNLSLSGRFYDQGSRLILEIDKNEWRAFAGNWDVEQIANRLVIREESYRISLQVVAESAHEVSFDDLSMSYRDVGLRTREGECIEISYRSNPVVVHRPNAPGGRGIETKGPLNIGRDGQIAPLTGPTTIGAGTLRVGSPDGGSQDGSVRPYLRSGPKVARNDPCPCGSGRKYKKCH